MAEQKKMKMRKLMTRVIVRAGSKKGAVGRFTKEERVIFVSPDALRFMIRHDMTMVEA